MINDVLECGDVPPRVGGEVESEVGEGVDGCVCEEYSVLELRVHLFRGDAN